MGGGGVSSDLELLEVALEERVHVDAGHEVTPAMAEDLRTFLTEDGPGPDAGRRRIGDTGGNTDRRTTRSQP
jgi:hypothetical protein